MSERAFPVLLRSGPAWLILALVLGIGTPAAAQLEVAASTVDGGGGTSSGGGFEVRGTAGQHDAGVIVSVSFELQGGFWSSLETIVPVELMSFEIASDDEIASDNADRDSRQGVQASQTIARDHEACRLESPRVAEAQRRGPTRNPEPAPSQTASRSP